MSPVFYILLLLVAPDIDQVAVLAGEFIEPLLSLLFTLASLFLVDCFEDLLNVGAIWLAFPQCR